MVWDWFDKPRPPPKRGPPSTDAQLRISNARLRDEIFEAKQIMADFVRETDDWNAAICKLIGKPPGYCWETLERARKFVSGKAP